MRAFFLTLLPIFLGGCISTPLPEYNYRGVVPGSSAFTSATVVDFAATLARDSGLRIVSQTEPTGNARMDERVLIDLRPKSGERIYVTVMGYLPERTLFVGIGGNIESPEAKRIAQRAEAVYEREYSGSRLTAFTRYQGLLGP